MKTRVILFTALTLLSNPSHAFNIRTCLLKMQAWLADATVKVDPSLSAQDPEFADIIKNLGVISAKNAADLERRSERILARRYGENADEGKLQSYRIKIAQHVLRSKKSDALNSVVDLIKGRLRSIDPAEPGKVEAALTRLIDGGVAVEGAPPISDQAKILVLNAYRTWVLREVPFATQFLSIPANTEL